MGTNNNSVAYMKTYLRYAAEFEKYVYIWSHAMNEANNRKKSIYDESQKLQQMQSSNENRLLGLDRSFDNKRRIIDREIKKYSKRTGISVAAIFATVLLILLTYSVVKIEYTVYMVICAIFFIFPVCLIITVKSRGKIAGLKKERDSFADSGSERRQAIIMQARGNDYEKRLSEAEIRKSEINMRQKEIQSALYEAKNNLQRIYTANVLPTKYRNLVAVTTLYEYLETGRCNTIQGHGGIYDTYEKERIQLAQLQQMIETNQRLSRIEDNQRYICQELYKMNNSLSAIKSSLKSIENTNAQIAKNTAISAVANQQTAAAARWMAWDRQYGR